MQVRSLSKLLILLFIPFLFASVPVSADVTLEEAAKLLPDRVGDFSARGSARIPRVGIFEQHRPEDFGAYSQAARVYISPGGEAFGVDLVRTRSDSGAYALLTSGGMYAPSPQTTRLYDVGTAGIATPNGIAFFKGTAFVSIYHLDKMPKSTDGIMAFAHLFAQSLSAGEGEIPVLVKHLPDWETARERAIYAVSAGSLQKAAGHQPALEAINFEGGTEAVIADYGAARLVLVEYTTPQLATDSDARITARLKELGDKGESSAAPSAYRRVGNYSVFVFNAPDEGTAQRLIDSVTYEQVVQWLGDNPRALERMQRIYTETTAGIILAVIKASGLAVLLCLGVGGIFGALIFRRRRAQQAEAYSDAGDMIRLNIDDLTPQSSPARLLGRGDG